jgi:PAS domain S-box-containing protein/diguanylate cyclase (GGDEF)-like protein
MSDLLHPDVFRRVVEELQIGVYFTDPDRRIIFWNSGAERITGYLRQEVVGRCCRDNILMHCDHQQVVVCGTVCPLTEALADGKPREASLFLRHKTGHRIPIRIHTMPLRDSSGSIVGAAECFQRHREVPHPDRREVQATASYSYSTVPDYGFLISELRMRLARLSEGGLPFGVLCMEIDHFEELRTNRGHEACEMVLHVIASTVQNTIRAGDFVGRWSPSRLLLVQSASALDSLAHSAERLCGLVSCSSVVWWGDPLPVTSSVGGTLAKPDDSIDIVVRRAERALEVSLALGGDCARVLAD